jgi:hypothetical protein
LIKLVNCYVLLASTRMHGATNPKSCVRILRAMTEHQMHEKAQELRQGAWQCFHVTLAQTLSRSGAHTQLETSA